MMHLPLAINIHESISVVLYCSVSSPPILDGTRHWFGDERVGNKLRYDMTEANG